VCVVFTMSEVLKREITGIPITGHFEVVELISAVILSMGIGYLTFVRGHVAVDVLVMRFRPRRQAIFDLVNSVISLSFTILLTWSIVALAIMFQETGAVTGILGIPLHPFVYVMTAALAITCVVLIRDMVKAVIMVRTGGEA